MINFNLNLRQKVLYAFFALSLIPLLILAFMSSHSLRLVEAILHDATTAALNVQAARALEMRAELTARSVSDFLRSIEADLGEFARLQPTPENYLSFSAGHQREIWYRAGTNATPSEVREPVPLYSELAFIDRNGNELLRVVDGSLTTALRNVADPSATTYRSETYFRDALALPPGEIYVSHVTGWHVGKADQLRGASTPEGAVEGATFQGVVRFAVATRNPHGEITGVVVLSCDHRHLMEFTQHIDPTDKRWAVFPSYDSGNYAFMFDNEGWIITHPKFWDIRGVDAQGRLVPPYTAHSTPEDIAAGLIPYNLLHAGFIHPNYPVVADAVLAGRAGVVDVTNVGGSEKIMAFAPIFFAAGSYAESGVFGGITIGAELRHFHKAALSTSALITLEFTRFVSQSWLLIIMTALLVLLAATWLARSITGPLLQLIEGTREMARGNPAPAVQVKSHDEVGTLAKSFSAMATELHIRRERLMKTLEDLRRSRQEILREKNFKKTIVENIDIGILTLSATGEISSMNGPARRILDLEGAEQLHYRQILQFWPEVLGMIEAPLNLPAPKLWSDSVELRRGEKSLTFRLVLLPLGTRAAGGFILTIGDITERVQLRNRVERMQRLASLGRLAAGVAHEIRNPLTGVNLLLDELHDRLLNHPADQLLIRRALEEIERLEGLVNELLNFATLPQSRLQVGDLGGVLIDTLFLIQKQCQKTHVELEYDVPENLPPLQIDKDKLKQAFLNILTNALDAMPNGGRLRVCVVTMEDALQVVIEDSGEGMTEERIALIFEPFYTAKDGGIGLGLSITHNIISGHGGRIEVSSQPDRGTTFTLWFPLRQ
ncbi:MAG: ATP-binding protein [Desulfuromonadales bacterium]|nr:ATP-binding protein [Desulfuromonadales bacterium]